MTFLFGDDYYKTFTQLAKESGFRFNLYRGRIDWKKLDVLDVDRIVRDIDVEMLNVHVNNVINCNFDIEYDVKILDPNFVKLFRIAQLTIDFLLHCKHYFEQKLRDTSVELEATKQETEELKKLLDSKKFEIKQLKKNLKQKIKKEKSSSIISPGLRSNNVQCNMCGKVFIDDTYLHAHVTRRHAGQRLLDTIDHTTFLHQEIKELRNRLQSAEMRLYNENCMRETKENQVIESEQQTITKKYQDEIKDLKEMFFSEMQKLKQNAVKINDTEKVHFLENQPEEPSGKAVDHIHLDLNNSHKETDVDSIQDSKNSWEEKLEARETVWRSRLSTMDQEHKKELRELHEKLKSSHEEGLRLKNDFGKQLQEAMLKIEDEKNKEIKNLHHQITDNKVISTPVESTRNSIEIFEKRNSVDKDPDENVPLPLPFVKRRAFVYQKTIDLESENVQENMKRNGASISNNEDFEVESNEDNLGKQIESKIISLLKPKTIDSSFTSVEEKSSISLREDASETVLNSKEYVESVDFSKVHDVNTNRSDETSEESESDTIQDESDSSESDSQEEGNPTLQKELTLQSLQSMEEILASNPEILKELKIDLIQLLNRRLQELCIDPEWTGVPNKTFKTKMAVLKHHQKITAKHHTGYFTLRDHLLQNLEDRCVAKPNEIKPTPKQNILTRLHKKAVQVLSLARPSLGLAKKGKRYFKTSRNTC